MAELVYSKTTENRGHLDMLHGRTTADTKISVFAGPDKAAIVDSTLVVGPAKRGSNKKYYQWRTVGSMGFFRNRAGMPQPYYARRSWDFKRGEPWRHGNAGEVFDFLGNSNEVGQAFKEAAWSAFGVTNLYDVYPIAERYELPRYAFLPYDLRPAMRRTDWSEFVERAFGKTRVTPRMVAAVQQTEPYIVALAQQFKGLVPDEIMVSFMEDNHFDDEMNEGFKIHSPNVRTAIKYGLDERERVALLTRGLDLSDTRSISTIAGIGKGYQKAYATTTQKLKSNVSRTWSNFYM